MTRNIRFGMAVLMIMASAPALAEDGTSDRAAFHEADAIGVQFGLGGSGESGNHEGGSAALQLKVNRIGIKRCDSDSAPEDCVEGESYGTSTGKLEAGFIRDLTTFDPVLGIGAERTDQYLGLLRSSGACTFGVGAESHLGYSIHNRNGEVDLDGHFVASGGPAAGLICLLRDGLIVSVIGSLQLEGRLRGEEEGAVLEIGGSVKGEARVVMATGDGEWLGLRVDGAAKAFTGDVEEGSVGLSMEASPSGDLGNLMLGAEVRYVRLTEAETAERSESATSTGAYGGIYVGGAFTGL